MVERTSEEVTREIESLKKSREADEISRQNEIIAIAGLFELIENNESWKKLFEIANDVLTNLEEELDRCGKLRCKDILDKGTESYLMGKSALEGKIVSAQYFINIPKSFIELAKEIKKRRVSKQG